MEIPGIISKLFEQHRHAVLIASPGNQVWIDICAEVLKQGVDNQHYCELNTFVSSPDESDLIASKIFQQVDRNRVHKVGMNRFVSPGHLSTGNDKFDPQVFDRWYEEIHRKKEELNLKGVTVVHIDSFEYSKRLANPEEFFRMKLKVTHMLKKGSRVLCVYRLKPQEFGDKHFLRLIASHGSFLYLDEKGKLHMGEEAAYAILTKIEEALEGTIGCENVSNFLGWFKYLYGNFDGEIPGSFALFIPSKDKEGNKIPSSKIRKIIDEFVHSQFIQRFAGGLTLFNGKGYWVSGTGETDKEEVKVAEVNKASSKVEIFVGTVMLIFQGLFILESLNQEAVLIKVLDYPIFITGQPVKSPE